MFKALVLIFTLTLTACGTTTQIVEAPKTINHPEWPTPVMPYKFDWKVITVDDEVYVGLEYNQSVEFRVFMEDIKRYIKESNGMICFYRTDLLEQRCFKIVEK
jgi:hypothetical protein